MLDKQKTRILWADDEADSTMVFLRLDLEFAGYDVDVVKSVGDLIARLESYRQSAARPDLVLLDVMMPIRPNERALCEEKLGQRTPSLENYRTVGLALAQLVAKLLPEVPILCLTNLTEETDVGLHTLVALRAMPNVKRVLLKPTLFDALQREITKVLKEVQ